jgi:tRNA wybutosine-synthesizing protein 4
MLKHFDSLSTPLKSVSAYPRLGDQVRRYSSRGWNSVDACDLLAFWSNRIPGSERERIDSVELFDDYEEFFSFMEHYFVLYVHNGSNPHTPFHSPDIHWNGCGKYRRHPTTRTASISKTVHDEHASGFTAEFKSSPALRRRLGAAAAIGPNSLVFHGGQEYTAAGTAHLGTSLCITHSTVEGFPKGAARPDARTCHTMTTLLNGTVLLVGGRTTPDKPLKDVWLLDAGVWRRVDDLPSARYRHAATAIDDGRILVYGGRGEGSVVFGDWLLWCESRGWRSILVVGTTLPSPRFATGLCWTDRGYGAIAGGLNAQGDVLDDMWRFELHRDEQENDFVKPFWSMVCKPQGNARRAKLI